MAFILLKKLQITQKFRKVKKKKHETWTKKSGKVCEISVNNCRFLQHNNFRFKYPKFMIIGS